MSDKRDTHGKFISGDIQYKSLERDNKGRFVRRKPTVSTVDISEIENLIDSMPEKTGENNK